MRREVELSKSDDAEAEHGARTATRDRSASSAWAGWLRVLRGKLREHRERVRERAALNFTYRVAIGVLGTVVLLVGIVLIPYPGPGWLIVFAGLGLLATEFAVAQRVSAFGWRQYQRWLRWMARQHWTLKVAVALGTGLIVVVTLWLLGTFAEVASWFGVHWSWLASPLFGG